VKAQIIEIEKGGLDEVCILMCCLQLSILIRQCRNECSKHIETKFVTLSLLDIPVIFGLSIKVYFLLIIIAIPTFLFWKWLLKKYIKVDKTRIFSVWAATLLVPPVIYVVLILLFLFAMSYTPSKNFDKLEWLTDKEGRFEMANDIIKSKMLIGKDTTQIKQILSDPTWGGDSTKVWIYDMGFGGEAFSSIFHSLNLQLDSKEKVILVEHIKIRD
jgi:hypothetical protein